MKHQARPLLCDTLWLLLCVFTDSKRYVNVLQAIVQGMCNSYALANVKGLATVM